MKREPISVLFIPSALFLHLKNFTFHGNESYFLAPSRPAGQPCNRIHISHVMPCNQSLANQSNALIICHTCNATVIYVLSHRSHPYAYYAKRTCDIIINRGDRPHFLNQPIDPHRRFLFLSPFLLFFLRFFVCFKFRACSHR